MDMRKFFAPACAKEGAKIDTSSHGRDELPGAAEKQEDKSCESRSGMVASTVAAACEGHDLKDEPYQPDDVNCIPSQKLAKRQLKFQQNWFSKYPWLHFDASSGGVLCHICVIAKHRQLSQLTKCGEESFVSRGFTNWKKAIEKFDAHQRSNVHRLSLDNLQFHKTQESVDAQISSGMLADQKEAREALLKLISSMKFLAEQGLSIRGKQASDGNFIKLLKLRAEDLTTLKSWLARKQNFTSGEIQNELLQIMSHTIVRELCKDVRNMSSQFGIMVDGTQDIQGVEQESICVRYVTDTFDVREEFLGLYNISSTTGQSISRMLVDALIRLQLPIEQLRAQTYDGASNMSGQYHGCQAEIKKLQPLAKYVHCGAHVTHLVTSKAVQAAPFVKDSLDHIHELGKLYQGSGKFKHLYLHLHDHDTETVSPARLKPICPTRWLTRASAVTSALHNYADVLDALQEASAKFGSNTGSRATGIYNCLSSGKCILGLLASLPIINSLESLNKSLQGSGVNVSGMLDSVKIVSDDLKKLRSEEKFSDLYQEAEERITELNLSPLSLPRQRKRPKRFEEGSAQPVTMDTAEQVYRIQFFMAIDTALASIHNYFVSSDLAVYEELSALLLHGTTVDRDTVKQYPELTDELEFQLSFYRNHHASTTIEGHRVNIFQAMEPSVRRMFPQVERLLRLLLVSPASSCEAERSFSALRRMKTWLRTTMTQQRLNHVMVCHVHNDRLGALDCRQIAEEFIARCSDSRRKVFGKF